MPKRFLIAFLMLSLAGCAANLKREYQDQLRNSTTLIAYSFKQAIQQASSTPLPIGWEVFPKKWEISGTDPRLAVDQEPGSYRVFDFQLKKGQAYVIQLRSMCNYMCLALLNTALKPRVAVVNAQGDLIVDHLLNDNSMIIKWSGVAPYDGKYFLIVAADNQAPGEFFYYAYKSISPGVIVSDAMISAPFGVVTAYVEIPDD
ncbi:hypothetical protein KDX30_18065 [Pseudomonas sp. CDFA 553]|uniref:hypothetical protein n=1 Tax=Pseudomonas quasicaspiana TaxID=2829821 RepID=UPI001E47AC6D|nr:hypothetical protein [Pseudomonas quasicaspiana]MCD5989802.1 hypothetical protein [Pseudomonas quasicaspiana]